MKNLLGEVIQFARLDLHPVRIVHNLVPRLQATHVEVLDLIRSRVVVVRLR